VCGWYDAVARVNDAVDSTFGVSGTYTHTATGTSETVLIDTYEPYYSQDLGGETEQSARQPAGDVTLTDLSEAPAQDDTFVPSDGPEAGNTLLVVDVEPDGDGQATLRFMVQ